MQVTSVSAAEYARAAKALQTARKDYESLRNELQDVSSALSVLADAAKDAEAARSRAEQALADAKEEYEKELSKMDFVSKRLDVQARFDEWSEAWRKAQCGCPNAVVVRHQRLKNMLDGTSLKMVTTSDTSLQNSLRHKGELMIDEL